MMFGKSVSLEGAKGHAVDRVVLELRDLSLEEERIQIKDIQSEDTGR